MQVLAPNALSSIPPTQTGMPAFSANLFISIALVRPPTLPGLILIYLHAFNSIACLALSTLFIDSSKHRGVLIDFASFEWSSKSSNDSGCSINANWYLSIDLNKFKSSKKYPPLQSIWNTDLGNEFVTAFITSRSHPFFTFNFMLQILWKLIFGCQK